MKTLPIMVALKRLRNLMAFLFHNKMQA